MIIILISLWKITKKEKLKDLFCRFLQSGKQMESGPETMNKKLNTWNIYSNHMGVRKEKKR
jgi:hypothetical protein